MSEHRAGAVGLSPVGGCSSARPKPPVGRGRSRLARHLAIVLLVKVVLLTALWHAFIKPNKVTVDVDAMGSRIAGTPSQLHEEEKAHDRLDRR